MSPYPSPARWQVQADLFDAGHAIGIVACQLGPQGERLWCVGQRCPSNATPLQLADTLRGLAALVEKGPDPSPRRLTRKELDELWDEMGRDHEPWGRGRTG